MGEVGLSIDETTNKEDMGWIIEVFAKAANKEFGPVEEYPDNYLVSEQFRRASAYMGTGSVSTNTGLKQKW